jgi:hypothetical protein
MITALGTGAAIGAWTAGLIADRAEGQAAFLVAVIAGGAAVMVAMCGRGKLLLYRDEREGPVQKS